MSSFYLVRLGKANSYAGECYQQGFIGVNFIGAIDLSETLPEDWRVFNRKYIPLWMEQNPGKSKVAAGLACGNLWVVCKGMHLGDLVLSPLGDGSFAVGEVCGSYEFHADHGLPHQRRVQWKTTILKEHMSDSLKNATGAIMTAFSLEKYHAELEQLLSGTSVQMTTEGQKVEDITAFALERHLEDFLVVNWNKTTLGQEYDIYTVDGEIIGQQYPSDTGPIDILAISKDKNTLLVVELKRGRASDVVVGQIQRYMGYIKEEVAEVGQTVKGLIIAFEDDLRLRRALSVTQNIEVMLYELTFTLRPL